METRLRRKRNTTTTKSSAETVGSIDDLLTEILIRLPANPLAQFKLVSKHWHSLITNPQFIRRWRYPDPNPAVGMFFPIKHNHYLSEYVSFFAEKSRKNPRKDPSSSGIRILNSCKGLLLCEESNTKDYYVYNPFTNQYSNALPKLDGNIVGMSLAFDPAKSPHHYKVVCVRCREFIRAAPHKYQIEIYSTETPDAWRSSVLQPFTSCVDFSNGVYWNGAIHWMCSWNGGSLYFNIHHQVLDKMPYPPTPRFDHVKMHFYFGESCDHLHYIPIFANEIQFDVYEMKKDYSEWFVKYRVDLSLVLPPSPHTVRARHKRKTTARSKRTITARPKRTFWFYAAFCILSIVRGDQDEEDASFLVLQIPGKAIRYNIVQKTVEDLHAIKDEFVGEEPGDLRRFQRINGFQYIESLCSV